jgi:hypothetical protein
MRAKTFFYVCAGLLMLAVTYHLGASSAGAQQAPGEITGIMYFEGVTTVVTSNGDIYARASQLWRCQSGVWEWRSFGEGV